MYEAQMDSLRENCILKKFKHKNSVSTTSAAAPSKKDSIKNLAHCPTNIDFAANAINNRIRHANSVCAGVKV